MNKKAIYSILSTIVAMVVLSVSLVFVIGPRVSADSKVVVTIDSLDCFNTSVDDFGHISIIDLSDTCAKYLYSIFGYSSENFNLNSGIEIHVKIPEGVYACRCSRKNIISTLTYPYGWGAYVTELTLPDSLEIIRYGSFQGFDITSIIIPASVSTIEECVFSDCTKLTEIVIQNPDLLTNENLQSYVDIMRYEAPQNTSEDPTEPEPTEPETPVENPVENQSTTNNPNNIGLIAGIAGTSAGVMLIVGIVLGIMIGKRRRK